MGMVMGVVVDGRSDGRAGGRRMDGRTGVEQTGVLNCAVHGAWDGRG